MKKIKVFNVIVNEYTQKDHVQRKIHAHFTNRESAEHVSYGRGAMGTKAEVLKGEIIIFKSAKEFANYTNEEVVVLSKINAKKKKVALSKLSKKEKKLLGLI